MMPKNTARLGKYHSVLLPNLGKGNEFPLQPFRVRPHDPY
jgi:hypothetical protein